jgi:hypothetical protein
VKKSPIVIGWLQGGGGSAATLDRGLAVFKEELCRLGWKEGQQFVVEARAAEGRVERLQSLAKELAARKPAVIVTTLGATTAVARAAPNRVEARFAEVAGAEELDAALSLLAKEGVQGLVVLPSTGLLIAERERIVKFALGQRWPVVAGLQVFADAGALLSYSATRPASCRHRVARAGVDSRNRQSASDPTGTYLTIRRPETTKVGANFSPPRRGRAGSASERGGHVGAWP